MNTCEDCLKLPKGRRAPPHRSLASDGYAGSYAPAGQRAVNIEKYVCRACGQRWTFENDSNDDFVGWEEQS